MFLLPVVETGLNTRPVPSFSVWFHSHLFIIPLLLVQKDCSITHPLPCSLLSTEALIFFPLFSFPPQPLSCLLASPFLLFCRMITPCAACPSSVSSSSYLISVIWPWLLFLYNNLNTQSWPCFPDGRILAVFCLVGNLAPLSAIPTIRSSAIGFRINKLVLLKYTRQINSV